MKVNFNYRGANYNAAIIEQDEHKLVISLKDKELDKEFGETMPFFVENKKVGFNNSNRSHSELYALSSSISNAINEQCEAIL